VIAHADDSRTGIVRRMMGASEVFARRPAGVAWPNRLALRASLARAFVALGVDGRLLLVLRRTMAFAAPWFVTSRFLTS
jgi:hypothetical protein